MWRAKGEVQGELQSDTHCIPPCTLPCIPPCTLPCACTHLPGTLADSPSGPMPWPRMSWPPRPSSYPLSKLRLSAGTHPAWRAGTASHRVRSRRQTCAVRGASWHRGYRPSFRQVCSGARRGGARWAGMPRHWPSQHTTTLQAPPPARGQAPQVAYGAHQQVAYGAHQRDSLQLPRHSALAGVSITRT